MVSNYNELYHHGILGQKWGVRRYQYEDGSLTPEGKKRYGRGNDTSVKAKKLFDRDFDSRKAMSVALKERDEAISKIKKPSNNEMVKNGEFTDIAKQYYRKIGDIEDLYNSKTRELYKAEQNERDSLVKDVFFNKSIKKDVAIARDIHSKIKNEYDKTISYTGSYTKEAYKEWKHNNPNEDDYYFYHYLWNPGNASYDKAYKKYEDHVKELEKEYDSITTKIGHYVCGSIADSVAIDSSETYAEIGKSEIQVILNALRYKDLVQKL